MTGVFLLDWAIQAISLFNAALMLWLGLTIALNAERAAGAADNRSAVAARSPAWGPALIAGSLLAGALFFISHSAILAFDLNTFSRGLNFWWQVGWWPVLGLPLAWYVLILWYAGYWSEPEAGWRRRHRAGLALGALGLAGLVGLVLFANPLPALGPLPATGSLAAPTVGGLPLLIWILVITYLAFGAILKKTQFGRWVILIGGNPTAPFRAGIDVDGVLYRVFILSGVVAAFAGFLLAARTNGATPNLGVGMLFEVFAAVVIGGVSLRGGIGGLSGVFAGALLLSTIDTAINVMGLDASYMQVIRGALMLVAVLLDSVKQAIERKYG